MIHTDISNTVIRGSTIGLRHPHKRNLLSILWPFFVLIISVCAFEISMYGIDARQMTDLGFLSLLTPVAYATLLVLLISACILIFHQTDDTVAIICFLFAIIFLIHGTPNIVYGTLRYSWAWKHIGIVDYIQTYGSVNPFLKSLGIYHNWPGFFSYMAFLTDITGIQSPINLAGWAPVIFNVLYLLTLLFLYTALSIDKRIIWFSALLYCFTNWVGQDYFAPQSLGYLLHLLIVGTLLRWFRITTLPNLVEVQRVPIIGRFAIQIMALFNRSLDNETPVNTAGRVELVGFQVIIVAMFGVIVVSHQITPFMTLVTIIGLTIFRQTNTIRLVVILVLLFITWLTTGAATYMQTALSSMIRDFLHIGDHLASNIHDTTHFSSNQIIVSWMTRGLTVAVFVLAGLGVVRRYRRKNLDFSLILCTLAPFATLVASSYGGEIVFRVYFFALPFLTFFISQLILPSYKAAHKWPKTIGAMAICSILLTGFLFSYYGKDGWNYFTPNEVAGIDYLSNNAPPGTLVIEGSRNYPSKYRNYTRFTYVELTQEINLNPSIMNDPAATIARWMSDTKYAASFTVISRSQILEEHGVGSLPNGTLEGIKQTLLDSLAFRVVYSNEDVVIFRRADQFDAY